ncbi:MAG: DUF2254 family protein [Actinomycetes bacterium]
MASEPQSVGPQPTGPGQHSRLRNPSRRLRIGLVQLGCAVGGLVLALLATQVPWSPKLPSASIVPVMLAMAFSVVGLLTIIFSLMFTVVEWVYATFSMRLRKFESKPLTWWVFGIAIGIFVYSMAAAGLTLGQDQISWVVPGITVVAALVALVLMRRVQLEAFSSVQLGQTLADLCSEGLAAVRDNYPSLSDDGTERRAVDEPVATGGSAVAWEGPPAVFQELDESTLVSQLEAGGGTCHFTVGVGSFPTPGMIIANATGDPPIELARVLVTGVDRTPIQDPLLSSPQAGAGCRTLSETRCGASPASLA